MKKPFYFFWYCLLAGLFTVGKRTGIFLIPVCSPLLFTSACASNKASDSFPEEPYQKEELMIHDSFDSAEDTNWVVESEEPLELKKMLAEGDLDIDVSKGITIWYSQKLKGNILIEFEATVVDTGGPNDRVSDFNCFWMASDPAHPDNFFARTAWRGGTFWNYYSLHLYYVGLGGHDNTKTRFRKYDGQANPQPRVIGEYTDAQNLIVANQKSRVSIACYNGLVHYFYNGRKLFELREEHPLTEGYFGFRTVNNHMKIHDFKVYRLEQNRK